MTDEEFALLRTSIDDDSIAVRTVELTEEQFADLTVEQASSIVASHGASTLIRLPMREQQFFEWLRENDPTVWNDLWEGDESPYIVSLAHLVDLLPKGRGFLICDLVSQQNFNFSVVDITPEEGTGLLDASLQLVRDNGQLQLHQAFLVEVWRAPIDQWRFAWMYGLTLDVVKELVIWLISEGILTLARHPDDAQTENADDEVAQ